MRFFDFVSVKLSLCLILGIVLGYYFQPKLLLVIVLLAIGTLLLVLTKKTQKRNAFPIFGLLALSTTILLGILVIGFSLPKNQSDHYLGFPKTEGKIRLKITQVLKPNRFSSRYYASIKSIDEKSSSGTVILYVAHDSLVATLSVDDGILAQTAITPIPPPLNPHQFNFKDYLAKNSVHGQIRISENQFITFKGSSKTLIGIAAGFRTELIKKLEKQGFGNEQLGVIQALLLGQRNDISEETYANYKNAGAVHILAVSGLHIGILLLLLEFLLRPLERFPKGKTLKPVVIVALLWGYAFIAGLSPSIVRAVTMFSFLAYALHLNRPTNTFNVLALSLFFILLVRPLFLFQPGFQMSYAAVFTIVWVYPKLQRFWFSKNWLIQKVWQLLSVSLAAQLGVLPISLFYFHQFPALFFVSNLLVVPFLGIILGLGILVLVLTSINLVPPFLVSLYDGIIGGMNAIITWVAQQEAFLIKDIPFDKVQLILGYALMVGLVLALSKFNFKRLFFLLIGFTFFMGYLVVDAWVSKNQEGVWLLHQNKNSVILYQKGNGLNVISSDSTKVGTLIKNFEFTQRIDSVTHGSLKNHYTINGKKLIVIGGSGIYGSIKKPNYVLLTESPKINLERLIDSIQPKMILADGSNYKSYINRWKQTCLKRKLPFHYTGEKGAYRFHLNN